MNSARVKALALRNGADAAGIVSVGTIAEYSRFLEAVKEFPHGLAFIAKGSKRIDVRNWYHDAKSVLVGAFRYWGDGCAQYTSQDLGIDLKAHLEATGRRLRQPDLLAAPGAKIARYALENEDYHDYVPARLKATLAEVRAEKPGSDGVWFCDTSPLMEKELARLAGLGYRGKNTLLLSPKLGSWFCLGGIAFDFELEPDAPIEGDCGSCDRCERACPTGALKGGRLDVGRCLSYWTTHARQPMPPELAAQNAGWAYGCDACQECCPVNGGVN